MPLRQKRIKQVGSCQCTHLSDCLVSFSFRIPSYVAKTYCYFIRTGSCHWTHPDSIRLMPLDLIGLGSGSCHWACSISVKLMPLDFTKFAVLSAYLRLKRPYLLKELAHPSIPVGIRQGTGATVDHLRIGHLGGLHDVVGTDVLGTDQAGYSNEFIALIQ